ncbi:hypothetical protein BJY04DRAFT_213574 [Aspergillus karnatakaensis]|uniref:GNAT family N-acetyltransferase n=1 Tax=Aspergillus karnatakaensis TaxID=1810916 RepID=UPI003CCCE9B5
MPHVSITSDTWNNLDPASDLLGRVFDRDPVLRYMLCNLSDEEYQEYLQRYWRGLCRAAFLNGGVISEADGWKSTAVVLPLGKSRMLGEYSGRTSAVKKKALGKQENYYVFAIGTEYDHQGKGFAKALMQAVQEDAWKMEVPVWLEATTERSRKLYLSLGFDDVEEITLGKESTAEDGTMEHGGQGVTMWAMVWWPQPCAMKRNAHRGGIAELDSPSPTSRR